MLPLVDGWGPADAPPKEHRLNLFNDFLTSFRTKGPPSLWYIVYNIISPFLNLIYWCRKTEVVEVDSPFRDPNLPLTDARYRRFLAMGGRTNPGALHRTWVARVLVNLAEYFLSALSNRILRFLSPFYVVTFLDMSLA